MKKWKISADSLPDNLCSLFVVRLSDAKIIRLICLFSSIHQESFPATDFETRQKDDDEIVVALQLDNPVPGLRLFSFFFEAAISLLHDI